MHETNQCEPMCTLIPLCTPVHFCFNLSLCDLGSSGGRSSPGVHIRGAYQGCILSLDTTVQPGCKQGCRQSIKTQISIVASTQRYRLLKSVGMEDIKRPFMWKINVVSESSTTINNSMAPTKVAQILVGRKNIHIPLFTHHCPWPDQHHCHHHCHCHLRQRRFT